MMGVSVLMVYMFTLSIVGVISSVCMYINNSGVVLEWMFLEINSLNVEFLICMDWISLLFVSVVVLISFMILGYSLSYMNEEKFLLRYLYLVGLFVFSMILMVISPNMISIMFGWDGLGLVSFCLVVYYQNYSSYNSGMLTVLMNRFGDVMILMVIGMMMMYGSWNICMIEGKWMLVFFLMVAAMTKSAQMPFSSWLPSAMSAPTPVSALVHSSTLVTAGVYLMIRFYEMLLEVELNSVLLFISVVTMFMSGFMAMFEFDLKKIIALSTLSQLGMMMMILSMGLPVLSFYHLLNHAIFKSLLFMSVGVIIHLMSNNQDIRLMGNLKNKMSFVLVSFLVSLMGLMGIPFFSGFYSKDLIMEMVYLKMLNIMMFYLSLVSVMFTVMYSFRLVYYVFFVEVGFMVFFVEEDKLMNYSMMILMFLSVVIGSLFNWMFFFEYVSFLKLGMKSLTLVVILFSVFLVFLCSFVNLMKMYFYLYFFSSMWFLNYIHLWVVKSILYLSVNMYLLDKMWMEFYSVKFFSFFLYNKNNVKVDNFKMFMMIMFMLMCGLIIRM